MRALIVFLLPIFDSNLMQSAAFGIFSKFWNADILPLSPASLMFCKVNFEITSFKPVLQDSVLWTCQCLCVIGLQQSPNKLIGS